MFTLFLFLIIKPNVLCMLVPGAGVEQSWLEHSLWALSILWSLQKLFRNRHICRRSRWSTEMERLDWISSSVTHFTSMDLFLFDPCSFCCIYVIASLFCIAQMLNQWLCLSQLRFFLYQIERQTFGMLQCHPHPDDFSDPQRPYHCCFFMGLQRKQGMPSQEGEQFGIRAT